MIKLAPTTMNAMAYAYVGNLLLANLKTPLTDLALQHLNLHAYCERMTARCFPHLRK
jgi:hypothetical protein